MDASFVRECIRTDDCLIALHDHAGQTAQKPACLNQFLVVDVRRDAQKLMACFNRHNDLFQRSISGAFADAVDGAFHLADAVLNRRYGICDRESEVVMTMRTEHRLADVGNTPADFFEHRTVFVRVLRSPRCQAD